MLGEIENKRKMWQQRMRWLHGITDLMDMNLSKLREIVKDYILTLLKLMSIESVMPSNHLIIWHPLLLLPSIFTA